MNNKERLKLKHLPKITKNFEEVVLNTTARMKCGTGMTEAFIIVFLDELKKVSIIRQRMIIPNFLEIRLEVKPEKQNNIKMRAGMTESQRKSIPVVPKHFAAKLKPHISYKAQVAKKSV